jgi:hypothetical protein
MMTKGEELDASKFGGGFCRSGRTIPKFNGSSLGSLASLGMRVEGVDAASPSQWERLAHQQRAILSAMREDMKRDPEAHTQQEVEEAAAKLRQLQAKDVRKGKLQELKARIERQGQDVNSKDSNGWKFSKACHSTQFAIGMCCVADCSEFLQRNCSHCCCRQWRLGMHTLIHICISVHAHVRIQYI